MGSRSVNTKVVFVDRRQGQDRRLDEDPCKAMPMDLFNRKRRKSKDRRDTDRSLSDDYYAFMEKTLSKIYKSTIKPK